MPGFDHHDAEDARRDRITAAWGMTFFETAPTRRSWVEERWMAANLAQREQGKSRALNEADGFDGDHLP